jgi:hypothetical protein
VEVQLNGFCIVVKTTGFYKVNGERAIEEQQSRTLSALAANA